MVTYFRIYFKISKISCQSLFFFSADTFIDFIDFLLYNCDLIEVYFCYEQEIKEI